MGRVDFCSSFEGVGTGYRGEHTSRGVRSDCAFLHYALTLQYRQTGIARHWVVLLIATLQSGVVPPATTTLQSAYPTLQTGRTLNFAVALPLKYFGAKGLTCALHLPDHFSSNRFIIPVMAPSQL